MAFLLSIFWVTLTAAAHTLATAVHGDTFRKSVFDDAIDISGVIVFSIDTDADVAAGDTLYAASSFLLSDPASRSVSQQRDIRAAVFNIISSSSGASRIGFQHLIDLFYAAFYPAAPGSSLAQYVAAKLDATSALYPLEGYLAEVTTTTHTNT